MKKTVAILAFLLLTVLLCSVCLADTAKIGGEANIRSGAGTGYDVIGVANSGESYTIKDTTTVNGVTWYHINYKGKDGYVAAHVTVVKTTPKPAATPKPTAKATTNGKSSTNTGSSVKNSAFRKVGNIVQFGHYEQDNRSLNGKEAIEWIVLDVQGNKALLLSRYCLDCQPYHWKYLPVDWATSYIRAWLNTTFLDAAFTIKEQEAIVTTTLSNDEGYNEWNISGGSSTEDMVFLLSYKQAVRYLNMGENARISPRASATAYAKSRGVKTSNESTTSDGTASVWWWLRSPGFYQDFAVNVLPDGSFWARKVNVYSNGVRPAIWVNLNKDLN